MRTSAELVTVRMRFHKSVRKILTCFMDTCIAVRTHACIHIASCLQVRVAMDSVLPLSTLVRFTTLSQEEKTQQVDYDDRIHAQLLVHICWSSCLAEVERACASCGFISMNMFQMVLLEMVSKQFCCV